MKHSLPTLDKSQLILTEKINTLRAVMINNQRGRYEPSSLGLSKALYESQNKLQGFNTMMPFFQNHTHVSQAKKQTSIYKQLPNTYQSTFSDKFESRSQSEIRFTQTSKSPFLDFNDNQIKSKVQNLVVTNRQQQALNYKSLANRLHSTNPSQGLSNLQRTASPNLKKQLIVATAPTKKSLSNYQPEFNLKPKQTLLSKVSINQYSKSHSTLQTNLQTQSTAQRSKQGGSIKFAGVNQVPAGVEKYIIRQDEIFEILVNAKLEDPKLSHDQLLKLRFERQQTQKPNDFDVQSTTSSQLRQQVEEAKQLMHESVTKQTQPLSEQTRQFICNLGIKLPSQEQDYKTECARYIKLLMQLYSKQFKKRKDFLVKDTKSQLTEMEKYIQKQKLFADAQLTPAQVRQMRQLAQQKILCQLADTDCEAKRKRGAGDDYSDTPSPRLTEKKRLKFELKMGKIFNTKVQDKRMHQLQSMYPNLSQVD